MKGSMKGFLSRLGVAWAFSEGFRWGSIVRASYGFHQGFRHWVQLFKGGSTKLTS